MAIKVYKGGSWVNTTGISAIGNADRLAIGQTNTSLATSDKAYYLSFVDANHVHTSRQYEDFYTGIGITFSPITNALSIGGDILSNGSLYLTGTSTDENGDIHSFGGSDGEFGIFNEGAGPLWISVKDSNNTTLVGIVSFSSESGSNFAARQSIFQSNINPRVTDTYDIGESAQLQWNNVYANCFHGDGTGLTGTGFWQPDNKENLKAGTDAGKCINDSTCHNIFIGYEAGKNTCSTAGGTANDGIADENIFIGRCSGHTNTTGAYNVFGGSHSGFCNTTGGCNVAFGNQAGYCNDTGGCNVFLGFCAGTYNITGSDNIFMGYKAGFCNRVHNDNIFLGFYSGTRTTGPDNIALGYSSLLGGPTGGGETPLSGQGNVAIGKDTGKLLGGGAHNHNVFLGTQAGQTQTAGSFNVVIGYNASTYCSAEGCQLSIGINADKWITGDCNFNIRPGKGIIDCSGSCGTEGQVLTSHKVAGTPDDYYVKWNTNASQATNADKIGIGTTTNAGGDNLQSYYLPFVRENNDHNNRQYEQLYSDSRLVFNYNASEDRSFVGIGTTNPRAAILHLESNGPILRLTDRDAPTNNRHWHIATNLDGILRLQAIDDSSDNDGNGGGGGDHFDFYREDENITEFRGVGAGITWFVVNNENENVGIGTTNPVADDINTSLQTNTSVLAVGIVTAREYYGTFKGIIDPGATVTLDKIQEGNTSAEVVDVGLSTHFKVTTDGTERLRIDDAGISTFSSDKALVARFQRIGNNDGKWAKVDIKANTTDGNSYLTFSDSAATELGAINYEHNDDSLRFEVWDRTNSTPSRKSRLRIGNLGQIGLYDGTSGGSGTSDSFGTDNQVLTSKGPNATPVWQTVSGIPASTSVQVEVTKVNDDTRYYLTGVTADNTGEDTTVDKTLYQNMPGAPANTHLYMKPSSGMLFLKNIRGDIVDPTGKIWPETNGDLKIVTSNFIPDTNSTTVDSNGDPTNGQNLGGPNNKFATVYAQKFDGLLGGTADKAKQLEVTQDNDNGTGHYFGMIRGISQSGATPQTFYTDTALTYNPSSDVLQAPNIKVTTLLNVEGDTTLGNQFTDTVTWNARSGVILPTGTPDETTNVTPTNLGSTDYKWKTVYAETFSGAFQGIAQNADSVQLAGVTHNKDYILTFIDWNNAAPNNDSDPAYKGLKFDADRNLSYNPNSNVLTVPNLAISGITTLGNALNSDKTIFKSKVDSAIVPLAPASGQAVDRHDIGSPNDKWGIVYATEFSGTMTGSVAQVNTEKADTIDGYVTFVENNHDNAAQSTVYTNGLLTYNSNASSEKLTVGGQLKVSKDAEFDEDVTLGHSAAEDKVTFNSKIAAPLTLGIGQILPFTIATVDKTAGIDLGSTGAYWKTIYAREFKGAITGNATSASALDPGATINLTTGNYIANNVYSGIDFNSTASTAFTGSSAYTITSALNTTGVTAGEYGSTTLIPKIKVDSKGRISSVSNQSISLSGATADKAKQLEVTERNNSADDYIPFVIGAPSSTATAKTFYSDSNLKYRSASDMLITSKISSDGSFPSAAGKIATTKEISSGVYGWEWCEGTASGIGRNYTLPLTVSGDTATWTLTDNVPSPNTNTNPIALTAGTGLTISSSSPGTTGGSFTISMDTSSNTAFKYKNTYATNAETTNKEDAVFQIYPSGGNAATDQKITITPGAGIKFSGYGAQALTIESDADVGASKVETTLATADSIHYLTFVTGNAAGTSKTLYQDSDSLTYNPFSNTLTTGNLTVTGNTTLGDNNGTDIVTWNAKSGTILPTNNTQNLGSQNDPWNTVYANNITGTLSVNTSDKQVLYTSGTSPAVVAGSDLFTYDGTILEVADAATATNYCQLTRDGGIEICRTNKNTGGNGGAFFDFRDDPAVSQDYIARIQLATHMANGGWNDPNDRGGLLFETGGTNHRHMLLTKDGVLGITRGTTASAILSNNGSNHSIGFVPGIPRDSTVAAGHNISNKVVLDVNGTLMLRRNGSTYEGGQITLNNVDDTIAYSIDVYGSTANNSLLRIIDEKTQVNNSRGTQRFAISRSGAFGIGDVGNESWGDQDVHVLISGGSGGQPYWGTPPSSGGTSGMYLERYTSTQNNWTPPTGYTTFVFIVIAGGGGSGSADGQDDDGCDGSSSGGGGGGAVSIWSYPYSSMGGTYTLTVGGGGPGGHQYAWQGNIGH